MAAFLPHIRSACRFLLPIAALALTGSFTPARAAHERPWLADTPQATIAQTIPLPGQAAWRQALTLPDGSVVLLREPGSGSGMGALMRLAPGAETVAPLEADWSGIAQNNTDAGGRAPDALSPVALARDESGMLWLIDQGSGERLPRLVRIDSATGRVLAVIPFPEEAVTPKSRFTALAIHGRMAYLADEGGVALTAIDLQRHAATRFFAGYPTSRGHSPLIVDGHVVQGKDGHPLTRDIAYLTLRPDGAWLYEQAPTGPIYRLSADLLKDPSVTPAELMEGVTQWRGTPTVGGLTMDDKETLYLTDISAGRLLSFDAGRHPHILLVSPALVHAGIPGWAPSPGPGSASAPATSGGSGQLYVPAGQTLLRIALP